MSLRIGQLLTLCLLFACCYCSDVENIAGYRLDTGRRCTGGSSVKVGETFTDAAKCASRCATEPTCFGFNWRPYEKVCVMRTRGCTMSNDDVGAFYEKLAQATPATTTTTTAESPRTNSWQYSSGDYDESGLGTFPGFTQNKGRRCAGGTSEQVGDIFNDPFQCASLCTNEPSCFGFNWRHADEVCVMRTPGCVMKDDTGASFYEKNRQNGVTQATLADTPASMQGFSGYSAEEGWRCPSNDGTIAEWEENDLNRCAQICDTNEKGRCFGFSVRKDHWGSICTVNLVGCEMEEFAGSTFYRKISQPASQSDVATVRFKPPPSDQVAKPGENNAADSDADDFWASFWNFWEEASATKSPIETAGYWDSFWNSAEETVTVKSQQSSDNIFSDAAEEVPIGEDRTFVGFSLEPGWRCTGSTIIGEEQEGDPTICADLCATADGQCLGFNLQQGERYYGNYLCETRPVDCVMVSDSSWKFYRRITSAGRKPQDENTVTIKYVPPNSQHQSQPNDYSENEPWSDMSDYETPSTSTTTTTTRTTRTRSPTTTTTTTTQPSGPLFEITKNVRCVGGLSRSLGASVLGLNDCSAMCVNNPDCYAFNYVASIEICGLRSHGCREQSNGAEGITLYKKVNFDDF